MIDISPMASFLNSFLSSDWNDLFILVVTCVLHSVLFLGICSATVAYLDRKIGADTQMRIGPNRVGMYGTAQGFADAFKFLFKQDNLPLSSRPSLFRWGPVLAASTLFIAVGPIPLAQNWVLVELDWGVLFTAMMLSLFQLLVFISAYSSGSHWSVLSSFRLIVSMISFFAPLALALLSAILVAGSANFSNIVLAQGGAPWHWLVFSYPTTMISCVVMYVSLMIWQLAPPFDTSSGNEEMNGGVYAEYSGVRLAVMGAFKHAQLVISCALVVTVFFGGWNFPISLESLGRAANIVQYLLFLAKVFTLVLLTLWVRWSLLRVRVDQLIFISWKVLAPLGLIGVILTALWVYIFSGRSVGEIL